MLTTTSLTEKNKQRALIALVQVLGLCVWFSATAVVPTLRTEWDIGEPAAVWLTASVQIGFVVGAIVSTVLNLADRIAPQRLLAASALAAGTCTAYLAWQVSGLTSAIPLRFFTGFFLAGIYPVGMKLMASWSDSSNRGRAFGVLLGALTLGSALPHLINSVGPLPWRMVMGAASGLTVVAAVLALLFIGAGPYLDTRPVRPYPRYALMMFRERGPRLANLGYFGHMWELYAFWTWISLFVLSGRVERGDSTENASVIAFFTIGIAGIMGCLAGGWASDRFGRPPTAVAALTVSGTCCLASPFFFASSTPILLIFLMIWGASVIADSGVFSTSLSETADSRFIGTALTAQTALGFLLTVVTIQSIPLLAAVVGWRFSFLLLAPGPAIGVVAMWALHTSTQPDKGTRS